jgi:hypothetical protein
MHRFTTAIFAATSALAVAPLGLASTAGAVGGPGGYGNAQDTVNALQAQGFNVQLNGAAVYPLSGRTSLASHRTTQRQRQFSRGHHRPDEVHHRLGRHILQGRVTTTSTGPVVTYARSQRRTDRDSSSARFRPSHIPLRGSCATLGLLTCIFADPPPPDILWQSTGFVGSFRM